MEQYIDYLYIIPAALIAIMCHELTHGLFSHLQGDPTPKEQGRLSLNPAKHLDLFGTLCLIFLGFGWAKPVQVDPRYYKNPKWGMALVALGGPLANFVIAFLSGLILTLIEFYLPYSDFSMIIYNFFLYLIITIPENITTIAIIEYINIVFLVSFERSFSLYISENFFLFWT